jgi:hypothetical protein
MEGSMIARDVLEVMNGEDDGTAGEARAEVKRP